MTDVALDDLARFRLEWPEPLLIDLIRDSYGDSENKADLLVPARIHTRFLRELFEGEIRPAAVSRVDLIGCCAARGIATEAIENADQAAFLEMMRIVRTRFRNSPKLCLHFMQRLHVALGRLPKRKPEDEKPMVDVTLGARRPVGSKANWRRMAPAA